MLVIYCAKDKQNQALKKIKPKGPYFFLSPNDDGVDHTATEVVVVGNHPHIVDRYKGIAKVEMAELNPSKPEPEETEDSDI